MFKFIFYGILCTAKIVEIKMSNHSKKSCKLTSKTNGRPVVNHARVNIDIAVVNCLHIFNVA